MTLKGLSRWLVRAYFGLIAVAFAFLFYIATEVTFRFADAVSLMWYLGSGILALVAFALLPLLVAAAWIDRRVKQAHRRRMIEPGP